MVQTAAAECPCSESMVNAALTTQLFFDKFKASSGCRWLLHAMPMLGGRGCQAPHVPLGSRAPWTALILHACAAVLRATSCASCQHA